VMIATIGTAAAVFALNPQLTRSTVIPILVIALIGLGAIIRMVKQSFRIAIAQKLLALRLEEGQTLFEKTRLMGTQVSEQALHDWNSLTEDNLKKYRGEHDVARFRFAGYKDVVGSFTTYRLEAKLNFLNELLEQLKV
jgi:hypothetical protein